MAPMAGQKGLAETSKMSKTINQISTSNPPDKKTRPFDGKTAADAQSVGILKNGK